MSTINVAQLRADLYKETGAAITDFDNDAADLYLNRSLWSLTNKYPFRETEKTKTFPTIVNIRNYAMPVAFEAIRQISIEDLTDQSHSILTKMTTLEYEDKYVNNTDANDKPERYVREGVSVKLWPTPDDVYTITLKHIIVLTDLSDSDPSFPLPKNWYEIVLFGGIWRAALGLRNFTMVESYKALQTAAIGDVVPIEAKEEIDSHRAGIMIDGYKADDSIYDQGI